MVPFIVQAQYYASYHQNPLTRYVHMAVVPFMILSSMILLGFVRIVITGVLDLSLAEIATALLLVYYFLLNWRLSLAFTPVCILFLWLAHWFSIGGPNGFALGAFFVTFVVAWSMQFIGYFIEGKRPVLVDNIKQALIAPLILTAELFFSMKRMSSLKEAIFGKTSDAEGSV